MFSDENALRTTRLTSQVCHAWRALMLATPSLWAKLIDLDNLHGPKESWRVELVRRSGTSFLWIKAKNAVLHMHDPVATLQFFFDLLRENWTRIQKFVVHINVNNSMISLPTDPTCWDPLYLPAPHLDTFDFSLLLAMQYRTRPPPPIFADNAPMLRIFISRGHRFNVKAPWLSHLRSLELCAIFTVCETLAVLTETPLLESLKINTIPEGDMTPPHPVVSLPKLSRLTLFVDVISGGALLSHLELPPACSLRYSTRHPWHWEADALNLRPEVEALSAFARRYFRFHTPAKITLDCSETYFKLKDSTRSGEGAPVFHITLSIDFAFPLHAITMLLQAFAVPELESVTRMWFAAEDLPTPPFTSFLACFPSVTKLKTSQVALPYLFGAQNQETILVGGPNVLFPALKRIRVSYDSEDDYGDISQFIVSRIDAGCPIDVLDMMADDPDACPDDEFLAEVKGLKVTWWSPVG